MRLAIYSPYLSSGVLGGGEKHILEFARVASQQHQVHIAISGTPGQQFTNQIASLTKQLEKFIGWEVSQLHFVPTPLGTSASLLNKLLWTRQYEYLYAVTDGSLFFSLARTNNLHIQVPFTHTMRSPIARLKLANWQKKNANSRFTQQVVEKAWQTTIPYVHYPLVNTDEFKQPGKKTNTILSVGRFFRQLHSKRQDVLVAAFAQLRDKHPQVFANWKLVLCGPKEDAQFAAQVEKQAAGLPVEFRYSVSRKELVALYGSARIFWHAAGFEQDPILHPEAVEHFGISLVEAMAAGAIPIVVGKGGPAEILTGELRQLLWESIAECVQTTHTVISQPQLELTLRNAVQQRAQDFGPKTFESTVWQML